MHSRTRSGEQHTENATHTQRGQRALNATQAGKRLVNATHTQRGQRAVNATHTQRGQRAVNATQAGKGLVNATQAGKVLVQVAVDGGTWLLLAVSGGVYSCPRSKCVFSKDTSVKGGYDIFLTTLPPVRRFPAKRRNGVKNVIMTVESKLNHPFLVDPRSYRDSGADLVMSFRRPVQNVAFLPQSYVDAPLQSFLQMRSEKKEVSALEQGVPRGIKAGVKPLSDGEMGVMPSSAGEMGGHSGVMMVGEPYTRRVQGMIAMMGNCDQRFTRRMTMISELPQHVHTLRFGGCFRHLGTPVPPSIAHCFKLGDRRQAKACALRGVMFAFAVENSYETAYVTEKLWVALRTGAIPVYSVGPIAENRLFLPHPDAALIVEDFASMAELGAYMRQIARTPALWHKHAMAWRSLPLANISERFLWAVEHSFVTMPCRLCEWWVAQNTSRA